MEENQIILNIACKPNRNLKHIQDVILGKQYNRALSHLNLTDHQNKSEIIELDLVYT